MNVWKYVCNLEDVKRGSELSFFIDQILVSDRTDRRTYIHTDGHTYRQTDGISILRAFLLINTILGELTSLRSQRFELIKEYYARFST